MKRALLTGGTGFVGANLARRLIREGHEVHLLVRPRYQAWRISEIQSDVQVHALNPDDTDALKVLVALIRPEWIFHLAAYGAYSSQTDMIRMIGTNLTFTVNLVEACIQQGFESFVHTGSSSEYGFKDHPPLEQEWIDPNSGYAVTKASATHFCRFSSLKYGVNITTLRLYSVFGAYEEPTRLIPTLILKGLEGTFPPLANPTVARDYIYVEDVNTACLLAAAQQGIKGAVYNVGTGVQTSLKEVVETAQRVLSIRNAPQWGSMPDRQWDTSVWVANPQAIKKDLGWYPSYTLEEGLRLTSEWFQHTPSMLAYYRDHRNLPQ